MLTTVYEVFRYTKESKRERGDEWSNHASASTQAIEFLAMKDTTLVLIDKVTREQVFCAERK